MPAKVKFGRRSGGFCPCGPHPSFEASTVTFRFGCWTAEIAVTLDTVIRIRQSEPKSNSTEVPPHSDDNRVGASVEEICGSGNATDFKSLDSLHGGVTYCMPGCSPLLGAIGAERLGIPYYCSPLFPRPAEI
jgi:hypothetical protein